MNKILKNIGSAIGFILLQCLVLNNIDFLLHVKNYIEVIVVNYGFFDPK